MAQWIKFTLLEKPYFDKQGDLLNRPLHKDRYGVAEIYGGGRVYPNLGKVSVIERHEEGEILLVLVDGDPKDVDALTDSFPITFRASPKVQRTEPLGFQAKALSDTEAQKIKKDMFKVEPLKDELGVTR